MSQIELEREVMSLDAKSRAELARKLLHSLDDLSEAELEVRSQQGAGLTATGEIVEKNGLHVWTGDVPLEQLWAHEATRRLEAFDRGEMRSYSRQEALKRVRDALS